MVLSKFRILQNTQSLISCICKKQRGDLILLPSSLRGALQKILLRPDLFKISSSLRTPQIAKSSSIAKNSLNVDNWSTGTIVNLCHWLSTSKVIRTSSYSLAIAFMNPHVQKQLRIVCAIILFQALWLIVIAVKMVTFEKLLLF
jgi:hypothetical protein